MIIFQSIKKERNVTFFYCILYRLDGTMDDIPKLVKTTRMESFLAICECWKTHREVRQQIRDGHYMCDTHTQREEAIKAFCHGGGRIISSLINDAEKSTETEEQLNE